MSNRLAVTLLSALLAVASASSALRCSSFTTETTCMNRPECQWLNTQVNLCVCKGVKIDVLLLVDSSGSIWPDEWEDAKNITVEILDLTSQFSDARFAYIQFSTIVQTELTFVESQSKTLPQLRQLFRNVPQLAARTNTTGALQTGINLIKAQRQPDRILVAIMLTDGNPTVGVPLIPCPLRQELDQLGIRLLLVAIGGSISIENLDCLVVDKNTDIIRAATFRQVQLRPLFEAIANPVCSIQTTTTTTVIPTLRPTTKPTNLPTSNPTRKPTQFPSIPATPRPTQISTGIWGAPTPYWASSWTYIGSKGRKNSWGKSSHRHHYHHHKRSWKPRWHDHGKSRYQYRSWQPKKSYRQRDHWSAPRTSRKGVWWDTQQKMCPWRKTTWKHP